MMISRIESNDFCLGGAENRGKGWKIVKIVVYSRRKIS